MALAELTILASREECARNCSNRNKSWKHAEFSRTDWRGNENERRNFDTFGRDASFIKGRVNTTLKFHAVETMGKNPVRRLRCDICVPRTVHTPIKACIIYSRGVQGVSSAGKRENRRDRSKYCPGLLENNDTRDKERKKKKRKRKDCDVPQFYVTRTTFNRRFSYYRETYTANKRDGQRNLKSTDGKSIPALYTHVYIHISTIIGQMKWRLRGEDLTAKEIQIIVN